MYIYMCVVTYTNTQMWALYFVMSLNQNVSLWGEIKCGIKAWSTACWR